MKACLQEERFLIFMSHQSDELSVSLCLSSCSYLEDFLPLPPHLSVGVIDFVCLCFSPPGSSTLDMRVWVCVCVGANIPVSPLGSLSFYSSSSSFVRLPVLSLTSLQRACPHLYHRPSCLLFCTLSRLLPVPSPSSTSLH